MSGAAGRRQSAAVKSVVFFRNVNQGERGHPSTADLLGALADAGLTGAVPFQSNGTVVVTDAAPRAVLDDVQAALAARSGIEREVFTMPLDEVAAIVDGHAHAPDASRRELTLHAGDVIDIDDAAVIAEAAHRRCRLVAAGAGWVVSANERDRESNATPVVERLTAAAATSRGLPTLVRLVDRFAPAG